MNRLYHFVFLFICSEIFLTATRAKHLTEQIEHEVYPFKSMPFGFQLDLLKQKSDRSYRDVTKSFKSIRNTVKGEGKCKGKCYPPPIKKEIPTTTTTEPTFYLPDVILFVQTPFIAVEIPVQGQSLPSDGCRFGSALFNDTKLQYEPNNYQQRYQETDVCNALLTRGNDEDPRYWVTIDPKTLRSRRSPRLCGRSRVFVERDELCHDPYDPSECSGGRRLFYSAYGNPVCDCPLGQYPFPTPRDDCVSLFQQGPCQSGYVVNFGQDGRLECAPSECPQSYFSVKPLVPMKEYGICYELGTTGPCNHTTELIGYDVFELRAKCVDVTEPLSPYFSSQEEENSVDDVYDQLYAEYDPYRILFVYKNKIEQKDSEKRRQGQNTLGSFQVSSSLPDVLLNPCRPGAQNGYNAKCINPILPENTERKRRGIKQAVRSLFACPDQKVLKATGQCRGANSSF